MAVIAVLGVGRVGSAVARTALAAGYEVNVAGSGPADDIALLAEIVIPGSRPMTTADAVADADIVIVAVPLHKHRSVEPALLAGKIIVDAMNYWAPVDGEIPDLERAGVTSSEIVADRLAEARVVKALNHIGYHDLEEDATPTGSQKRRALAVASDDEDAARVVMAMIDRFGFDPIYSGPLRTGGALQPGTPIFNGSFTAAELTHGLEAARLAIQSR